MRPSRRTFERFMRHVIHDLERVKAEDDGWSAFADYTVAKAVSPAVKRTMRQLVGVGLRGAVPESELRTIEVPVTLIWGQEDPLTPFRVGERLSSTLGWPLRVIGGSDHLPHVEPPEAFVRELAVAMDEG